MKTLISKTNFINQKILPDEFLNGFIFVKIILVCEAISHINLPLFAGSAFRGIFGRALRDLACVARNTPCPNCPLRIRCSYTNIFEAHPDPSLPIYHSVTDPPRPFVIQPPTEKELKSGQTFELRLNLFGNAIEHYPWVIQAVALAGKMGVGVGRGNFKLKRALEDPSEHVLVEGDRILGQPKILSIVDFPQRLAKDKLSIIFKTPVRLKLKGRLVDKLEFSTVTRHLLRRIAMIGAFHCGAMLETDFRQWIRLAEQVDCVHEDLRWFDWVRYSSRQKSTMRLGGLVGQVQYEGDMKLFSPLLTLGQITHLGKGATFGLGQYKLLDKAHESSYA